MANWTRTIKLNPEWAQAQNDEITTQQMAGVIASRLTALRPLDDAWAETQRQDLAEQFADASRDESLDVEEFDGLMDDLYDWGDTSLDASWNGEKVCWIDTISQAVAS